MNMLVNALLFTGIVVIDRVSKWMIINSGIGICKMTAWLSWSLHYNRGVSWSFLHAEDTVPFVLVSLLVGLITVIVLWQAYTRLRNGHPIYGQVMVLAGSCSNLFDRALYGGVIDFIQFHIGAWSFAIFNIADAAIVLGVCVMLMQEVYCQDA